MADRPGEELSAVLYQRLLALLGRDDAEAIPALEDALDQTNERLAAIRWEREEAERALERLIRERESSLEQLADRLRQLHALSIDRNRLAPLYARLEEQLTRLRER
jgi:hypothetical protein